MYLKALTESIDEITTARIMIILRALLRGQRITIGGLDFQLGVTKMNPDSISVGYHISDQTLILIDTGIDLLFDLAKKASPDEMDAIEKGLLQ
jgi:hypothetical protein